MLYTTHFDTFNMLSAQHYTVGYSISCSILWLCRILDHATQCAQHTTKYGMSYICHILLIMTCSMLSALHYRMQYPMQCAVCSGCVLCYIPKCSVLGVLHRIFTFLHTEHHLQCTMLFTAYFDSHQYVQAIALYYSMCSTHAVYYKIWDICDTGTGVLQKPGIL